MQKEKVFKNRKIRIFFLIRIFMMRTVYIIRRVYIIMNNNDNLFVDATFSLYIFEFILFYFS